MNEYIGKICPYCKTKLQQTDEIVICSDCGMPHHKECWIANSGCTTFGCLGTIDHPRQNAASSKADFEIVFDGEIVIGNLYCPQCGALNSRTNIFCPQCGSRLPQG